MKKMLIVLMFSILLVFSNGCSTTSGGVIVYSDPVVVFSDPWPTYYYCHPWWGWGHWGYPHHSYRLVPRPHHFRPTVIHPPVHKVQPPHQVPSVRPHEPIVRPPSMVRPNSNIQPRLVEPPNRPNTVPPRSQPQQRLSPHPR